MTLTHHGINNPICQANVAREISPSANRHAGAIGVNGAMDDFRDFPHKSSPGLNWLAGVEGSLPNGSPGQITVRMFRIEEPRRSVKEGGDEFHPQMTLGTPLSASYPLIGQLSQHGTSRLRIIRVLVSWLGGSTHGRAVAGPSTITLAAINPLNPVTFGRLADLTGNQGCHFTRWYLLPYALFWCRAINL